MIAGSEKDDLLLSIIAQGMSTCPPAHDAAFGPAVGIKHPIKRIPRLKWPEREAAYSYRSTPQYVYKSWCLISHRA